MRGWPLLATAAAAATRPNVVIILVDDVGVGDVPRLPAVAALAARGVNFTDLHSQPVCSPSRYALLSGRPPGDGRHDGGWAPNRHSLFLPGQRSIARALAYRAYRTGFLGKWGIGGRAVGVPAAFPDDTKWVDDWYERGSWVLSAAAAPFGHRLEAGPRALGFETSFMLPSGVQGPPFAWFEDDALGADYVPSRDGAKWLDPTNPSCGAASATRAHKFEDGGVSVTGVYDGRRLPAGICKRGARFQNGTYWRNVTDGTRTYRSDQADVVLARRARRFVQDGRDDDRPFFLLLSTAAAHSPYTPPKTLARRAVAGRGGSPFADVLEGLDALVAGVVRTLTEENKLDDTLLIVTSDNGGKPCGTKEYFGTWADASWPPHGPDRWKKAQDRSKHCAWESSGPLRGHKGDIYEGGHRVPTVASWPAALPRGATFPGLMSHTDLYHTILSFVAGAPNVDAPETSVDHSRVLLGSPDAWSADSGRRRLAVEGFKKGPDGRPRFALRDGALKLVVAAADRHCLSRKPVCADHEAKELYDLAVDLGETTNLLADARACATAVGMKCDGRRVKWRGYQGEALVARFLGIEKPAPRGRRRRPN